MNVDDLYFNKVHVLIPYQSDKISTPSFEIGREIQKIHMIFFFSPDHCNLQKMLHKLFHTVLMYSLQDEQDGWRVWVETAAAMHAYVSPL